MKKGISYASRQVEFDFTVKIINKGNLNIHIENQYEYTSEQNSSDT